MLKDLKKDFGDRVDVSVMGDAMFAAEPKEGIPSGLTLLDHKLGGPGRGAFIVGRMVEIFGPTSSAKSMLIGTAMGHAQREMGAICALVDTEQAYSVQFIRDICHADPDEIMYLDPTTLEDCWDVVDRFITAARERDAKRPIYIAIDSLAGLPSKEEEEADFDTYSSIATCARINKKAMRKLRKRIAHERVSLVMSNQEIAKINAAAFGEKVTTGGGGGPKFFSSIRLQMDQIAKVAEGEGSARELIGIRYRVTVYKNRFGFPGGKIDFLVDPRLGIDDVDSVVTFLKEKHQLGNEGKGRLVWSGEKLTLKQLKEKARKESDTWDQLRALARQTLDQTIDDEEPADAETAEGVE